MAKPSALGKINGRRLTNRYQDHWRAGIQVAMIRNRLQDHVRGKIELSATQIRAAEVLLRKVIPDLSSVQHTGEVQHRHITEYTDAELLAIVELSHRRDCGDRVVGEARGALIAADVHGVHDPELEGGEDPPRH